MNMFRIFKSTNCVPFVASVRKAGVSTILAILGLLGSTGAHAANPIVYSSGFEEASIAPFWTSVTAAFGQRLSFRRFRFTMALTPSSLNRAPGGNAKSLLHIPSEYLPEERSRSPSTTMRRERKHCMSS